MSSASNLLCLPSIINYLTAKSVTRIDSLQNINPCARRKYGESLLSVWLSAEKRCVSIYRRVVGHVERPFTGLKNVFVCV